jgi:hypothetical protein
MVKMQGKSRQYWDFLILGLSVYQAIVIPLQICMAADNFNSPLIITFDSIVNLIFLMDILIRFRTTFIHPITGEEVIDSSLIAERYLRGKNFIIDVLSTVPLNDWFGGEENILIL